MSDFLSLAHYDRIGLDTETDGLGYANRPVGLSIATPDGQDRYFAWGHAGGGNNCDLADVHEWLAEECRANPRLAFIMHNAGFDLRMLAYAGIKIPNRVEDTGIIAALLNELDETFSLDGQGEKYCGMRKTDDELNSYCATLFGGKATRQSQAKNYHKAPGDVVAPYAMNDARMTLALHDARRQQIITDGLTRVYEQETALIPVLLKMHMMGVRVDIAGAQLLKHNLLEELDSCRREWDATTGGLNPNSTQQLAPLFESMGITVPRTEKGNPSIDGDWLDSLEDVPLAQTIIRLRKLKHYSGTFIDNYILANAYDEVIHGEFHSVKNHRYGTVSGRFSSGGGLNLQNIPARDGVMAPQIRGLFIPYYDGQQWAKFDYSQIEYRFLAHYGGGNLRRQYNETPDIDFHEMVAEMTGLKRSPAKTINFGLVYGMGVKLLAASLRLPLDQAQEILEAYHARVPEVRRIYEKASNRAAARGWIQTWGERKRRFEKGRRGRYERTHKALNALLQGSAADLIKHAMIEVAKVIDWEDVILHLTVHDELDFSFTPGAVGERKLREIKDLMQSVQLTVPVISDLETGPDWGHVHEHTFAKAA